MSMRIPDPKLYDGKTRMWEQIYAAAFVSEMHLRCQEVGEYARNLPTEDIDNARLQAEAVADRWLGIAIDENFP